MAYYLLRIVVPPQLLELYSANVDRHNNIVNTKNAHFDAGFDLICPEDIEVKGSSTHKIDQGVKGEMRFFPLGADACSDTENGLPVGYYMYPRSSTGTKTPLRLANSVGIIDSGYRGNYIAVFDNFWDTPFKVEKLQRLVQICPPNLSYPMKIELVDNLDVNTARGTGGFGSTGK